MSLAPTNGESMWLMKKPFRGTKYPCQLLDYCNELKSLPLEYVSIDVVKERAKTSDGEGETHKIQHLYHEKCGC